MIVQKLIKQVTKVNLKASKNLFKCLPFKTFSSGTKHLKDVITQEIDHEEKNYEAVNSEDKNNFFQNSGFSFEEKDTSTSMTLKKVVDNFEVHVSFQAKPPSPNEGEDQNEKEKENENNHPDNMIDFMVKIKKVGQTKGLIVEAVTMETAINVNQIHYNDNIEKYYGDLMSGTNLNEVYMGPEFSTLDENLQNSFIEFLNSLGVNDELASFIEVISLDKDQRLYLNWLKNLKTFIL